MTTEIILLLAISAFIGCAVSFKRLLDASKPHGEDIYSDESNYTAQKVYKKTSFKKSSKHQPLRSNFQEDKFRWHDLPFLQFNCLNAPDMHSYKEFASIQNIGSDSSTDEETPQERFLPNIKSQLEEISIDEKTFRWGKLFVKPDAVFFDRAKNEYLVVEYKSREFYTLASLTPFNVFQLLISTEVVKKHIFSRLAKGADRKAIKFRSFMRLNNKSVEVRGWQASIQHVLAMLPDALASHEKDSLSATELARSFVLFDKVFKCSPQTREEACILGKLKHLRISKSATPQKLSSNVVSTKSHVKKLPNLGIC